MTALTERELLEPLWELTRRLGRDPMISEVGTQNGTASIVSYRTRFGSLRNALRIMHGKSHLITVHHSREELVQALKMKAEVISWRLTLGDIVKDPTMPPLYEYVVTFGGVNAAFTAADLPAPIPTRETLVRDFAREAQRLGRTPTQREVCKSKWLHSTSVYVKYFGSFRAVAIAAGLVPNEHGGAWKRKRRADAVANHSI